MKKNLICKCGHEESQHGKWKDSFTYRTVWGTACLVKDIKGIFMCFNCLEFEPDNLKYLENKYVERRKQTKN